MWRCTNSNFPKSIITPVRMIGDASSAFRADDLLDKHIQRIIQSVAIEPQDAGRGTKCMRLFQSSGAYREVGQASSIGLLREGDEA